MVNESEAIALMEAEMKNWNYDEAHGNGDKIVSDALRILGWSALADKYDESRAGWFYS